MAKRRFELTDETSNKFWEIQVTGAQMTVCFGRIGTPGTPKDKTFGSAAEAEREAAKLIAEKTKKGYAEVGASPAPQAKSAPQPKAKAEAKTAAAIPKTLRALLDAIYAKEKWLVPQLLPAATADALATLRALEPPSALVALYEVHDGTEHEMFGPYQLLPIDHIVAERAMMNSLLAKNPRWGKDGVWDTKWIPFMADGDGQYYCVDPTGSCDSGTAGQILFYDHEVGPRREFTSVDAFFSLLTSLAKAKLLDQEKQEDAEEKYEELYAEAKRVGLPSMPAKERKAILKKIDEDEDGLPPQVILDLVLPLVRRYPSEDELWDHVMHAAKALQQWPLLIEAASTTIRLKRREWKNQAVDALVLGLHRAGRDDDAFAALSAGLARITNANSNPVSLVPKELDPAVRRRALALVTDAAPAIVPWIEAWLVRGTEAIDPTERTRCLQEVVRLVKASKHSNGSWERFRFQAETLLEHDRVASLSPEARADALMAFAEQVAKDKHHKGEGAAKTWYEAASHAATLGRWKEALRAGERALEQCTEGDRYSMCHVVVRALHELGRDADALKTLRKSLTDTYAYGDDRYEAVPRHAERKAGNLERTPADAAFEAKCFAVLTDLEADDFGAWKWRAAFTKGPERKAVLEHILAFCTEAMTKDDYYGEKSLAEFAKTKQEVQKELART